MIKCKECDNEATMCSPDDLCDFHWAEWWIEGYPFTCEEDRKKELDFVLEGMKKRSDE